MGWARGDGGAGWRGLRRRGVTPGCCIVPVWDAVKAAVCSFGSAFRALCERGALHPSIPSRPAAGPAQVGLLGPPALPPPARCCGSVTCRGSRRSRLENILAALSIWLLAVLNVFFKRAGIVPSRFSRTAAGRLNIKDQHILPCYLSLCVKNLLVPSNSCLLKY